MEEQVSKIDEVIKGFHRRIEDLQSCTVPGTSSEEREGRERIMMTTIENIKKMEEGCTNLYEESV